jgi:hypothetical protein
MPLAPASQLLRLPPLGAPCGRPRPCGKRRSEQPRDDVFALWPLSARDRTPNSVYRPRGAGPPRAPEGPPGWHCTMRTALDNTHARGEVFLEHPEVPPLEACRTKRELAARVRELALRSGEPDLRCSILDGEWAGKDDNMIVGTAHRGRFFWEEDGHCTRLHIHGLRADTVRMHVDGTDHYGSLSEDGRWLRWADGDVWFRVVPESIVDVSAYSVSHASFELDEYLPWQNWTTRRRPGMVSGPSLKSLAQASWVDFTQSFRSDNNNGGDTEIFRPSAVFM